MKMGAELLLENSGNLHILTRLSARGNIIEFFSRESFKTCLELLFNLEQSIKAQRRIGVTAVLFL